MIIEVDESEMAALITAIREASLPIKGYLWDLLKRLEKQNTSLQSGNS